MILCLLCSWLRAGEQHHSQRLGDVQRDTNPQLGRGRLFQRGPRALQAVHVCGRDAVPGAGEIPQHGLPDLRQPLWQSSLGHLTGFSPPELPTVLH